MEMYTEFDYKKVLAILNQLKLEIEDTAKGYAWLEIQTFETKNTNCFNALGELSEVGNFDGSFSLIYCKFFIANSENLDSPLIVFDMGENQCRYCRYFSPLCIHETNKEIIKSVVPTEEKILTPWRHSISLFLSSVKIAIRGKLKPVEVIKV